MENALPKALTVRGEDAAQCPACLSFNFLRHLPQTRRRKGEAEGEHVIECVTCSKQYAAQFAQAGFRAA